MVVSGGLQLLRSSVDCFEGLGTFTNGNVGSHVVTTASPEMSGTLSCFSFLEFLNDSMGLDLHESRRDRRLQVYVRLLQSLDAMKWKKQVCPAGCRAPISGHIGELFIRKMVVQNRCVRFL